MSIWIPILLIILGIILLKQGAGWFVDGSSGLARKLGVSELAIGLTVVAFGTSAPELVVNALASVKGNHDIVFGNVIGSNSFNLFIILSAVALIIPIKVQSSTAWREIPLSLIVLIILFILANDQLLFGRDTSGLGRMDAAIMLLGFALFLLYVFSQLKTDRYVSTGVLGKSGNGRIALLLIAGLAGLVLGGKLVLDHAIKLAAMFGLSEKIIGLTIVAAGTSLPELATSVMAAAKRNHDVAVGNIIGSNIFNVLFILPFSAMIRPLRFDRDFNLDIVTLAGGTLVLFLAMYAGKRKCIDRWEAFVLLAGYAVYLYFMMRGTG